MQHLTNLDTPKTRTTSRGLTLTWTRCRLYVGPECLASEETPITCRDCLRAALDSIDVPLVHPVPMPPATDQWAYIERLRQATGKAQQAVLSGIGDVPLDGELFTIASCVIGRPSRSWRPRLATAIRRRILCQRPRLLLSNGAPSSPQRRQWPMACVWPWAYTHPQGR